VVITGIGLVSPIGIGHEAAWAAACAGRSGAGPITRFDARDLAVKIACEVPDFRPEEFMDHRTARRTDRFAQLAVAAGRLALADAGLSVSGDGVRVGAVVASGVGGAETRESAHARLLRDGPERVPPLTIPATTLNMAAAQVSIALGLRGPILCVMTACAAGAQAIGDAAEMIRRGAADVMLAGGAEAPITPFWVAGFDAMRVLSRGNEDPARAARPFDRSRDGFVIGEAGAIVVLERLDAARARGAEVIAEVAGYGCSVDAYHVSDPDPKGTACAAAVRAALDDAGLAPEEIGYVNAHGGGSRPGDPTEVLVLRTALGDEATARIPVSSTKPIHGHCMGATGALEAALTSLALRDGILPATVNLEDVDAACVGVDHLRGAAREEAIGAALTTSFGLGGHNVALALVRGQARPEEAGSVPRRGGPGRSA
jgi:3-oxoacyl-[acyl-carrier-protein] synthase II